MLRVVLPSIHPEVAAKRKASPTRSLHWCSARHAVPALVLLFVSVLTACIVWRSSHLGASKLTHEVIDALEYRPLRPLHASEHGPAPEPPRHLDPHNYIAGPPTTHFRDNLRNDTKYMTSWLVAGFTNDYMTIGNLIYLAMISSRVPVLPPFTSDIGGDRVPIAFSEIFDLPYLREQLGFPVLEWQDIKDFKRAEELGEPWDELGCWNVWEVVNMREKGPRGSLTAPTLGLDVSYTRAPSWIKLIPGFEHDSHATFWSLARLAFPETRREVLSDPGEHPTRPTQRLGNHLPPDEQMVCYDLLYYVVGTIPWEYELDYSPMWRFAVKHFRFTERLERLADGYLRRTLSVPDDEAIPPYITIHARRGDFADWCGDVARGQCFAPLSAYAQRVLEVQEELRRTRGVEVTRVIMTGNEQDPQWWQSVEDLGWLRVDHDGGRTTELYGKWYPIILDAVIQARGLGFVGTDRSTFSSLAKRRVAELNNGAVRTVKWGRPDADVH